MFKTLKILWLEVMRLYHYRMAMHYDEKARRQQIKGYCGILYDSKAWRHLDKELELNYKLHKLKGI